MVGSQVQLDEDVEIGPSCVLDGPVHIENGSRLIGHVYIQGPATIGPGNTFYPFCCIGFAPQDLNFDAKTLGAGVLIGRNNVFRESATAHRATGEKPTAIGDGNLFMANSHAGHDSIVGNNCVLGNGVLLGGHVQLADQVIIGGNAGLHQFCRCGRLVMIAGACGFTQDLPPFCVSYVDRTVGSLNLVGLRRSGYQEHIAALKEAFDLLYRCGHTNSRAVELIESQLGDNPLCRELVAFVKSSQRGICPYSPSQRRN